MTPPLCLLNRRRFRSRPIPATILAEVSVTLGPLQRRWAALARSPACSSSGSAAVAVISTLTPSAHLKSVNLENMLQHGGMLEPVFRIRSRTGLLDRLRRRLSKQATFISYPIISLPLPLPPSLSLPLPPSPLQLVLCNVRGRQNSLRHLYPGGSRPLGPEG